MSIATEITRITTLRDNIRTKLISLGIISDEAAKLSACASAIDGMKEATLSTPTIAVTPDITIDSATGIVTATGSGSGIVSATEGYSQGLSGTISASTEGSLQLETLGAQTITPGTANKTIAAGRWLTGAQTIKGDSNLIAANIKSGKSIFGVSGSMAQGYKLISGSSATTNLTSHTFNTPDGTWNPSSLGVGLNRMTFVALIAYLRWASSSSGATKPIIVTPGSNVISYLDSRGSWDEAYTSITNDVFYIPCVGVSKYYTLYYTIIGS